MNIRISSLFFLFSFSFTTTAWDGLSNGMDLRCQQNAIEKNIQCQYRSLDNIKPSNIQATIGSQNLPIEAEQIYPWLDTSSAVLFLIDTSDPARQKVVKKNLEQVVTLLDSLKPMHKAGLASFDKDLRIHSSIGAPKDQILASMPAIKAAGKTTELYRNLIESIQLLAKVNADRKNILIFSDGLAEDKAYFHNDVVQQARKHGVVITSLGYPRSTAQSVSLQRLRRISDETGGVYIEADANYDISNAFLNNPFNSVDNGGRFNIELGDIDYSDETIDNKLNISFIGDNGEIGFALPINIPKPINKQVANAVSAPIEATAATPETITTALPTRIKEPEIKIITATENKPFEKWLLYSLPVALIALLVLTIATFVMTMMRPKNKNYPILQTGDLKPFAYLVLQDETQRRYPITRTTWRIGRSKDNELSYNDNSISRRHCEIHREQGDIFTLLDLSSLNGVFVNNEKVKIHQLKEGDMLEIGDVNFRFTLHSADYPVEEATNIQKTKLPSMTQH